MAVIVILAEDGSALAFDCVPRYTIGSTVTVTDHPVEGGSDVADHAQKKPKTLAFTGIQTETPFDYQDATGGEDRVKRALEFLDRIAGTLVTVVMEVFGTIPNMTLTRYPTTRGPTRNLPFDVEFKQVRVATAGTVTITVDQVTPSSGTSDAEALLAGIVTVNNAAITAQAEAAATGLPDETDGGEQPTSSTLLGLAEAADMAP